MLDTRNALRWDGGPGHYEVYYLTATDPESGVGIWIRYTMVAPLAGTGQEPSCALWFAAMDPRPDAAATGARKATFSIDRLHATDNPFELRIAEAVLSDEGMVGAVDDAVWDLRWTPTRRSYEHVHPALRRLGIAKTSLILAHADLGLGGSVTIGDQRLELDGARGAQAHLWGSKHASAWAWAHCNDFRTLDGDRVPDTFIDAVSVRLPRLGREIGPSTPVLARVQGRDFHSTSPVRVVANPSRFALTGWQFEAVDATRRLIAEVDADRDQLVGVTYHDPDGELAYCYNSEIASMRLKIYERARQVGGWRHRQTLAAPGLAHYEYGQRAPVPGIELRTG
jgi:hypothetical protein